jgi:GGDEF domain-containing protein
LLEDISDISDATRIADQLQDELTNSNHLIEHDVFITTSIGIVLSVTGYNRPEKCCGTLILPCTGQRL